MQCSDSKNTKRILVFALIMSVFASALLITNSLSVSIIGYGAIYTVIALIFLIMFLLMRLFSRFYKRQMNFVETVLIGLPVFAISTILNFMVIHYDFDGTVVYRYYANGYFMNVLEETVKQFIPITSLFVLIFAPLYRQITKWKANQE